MKTMKRMSRQSSVSVIRVLIADDHKLFREGLRALLERDDEITVVGEARTGEEAVLNTRAFVPHLVLMDIEMPVTDGIAATKLIKEIKPDVKVLMLSNYENDERVYSAMKVGAKGYVLKRTGISDLIDIMRAVYNDEVIISPYLANLVLQQREEAERQDFALTERELKVLELLVKGYSNKEISNTTYISVDTVKAHLKHIFEKLGVDCRTKAAVRALKHKIITE